MVASDLIAYGEYLIEPKIEFMPEDTGPDRRWCVREYRVRKNINGVFRTVVHTGEPQFYLSRDDARQATLLAAAELIDGGYVGF